MRVTTDRTDEDHVIEMFARVFDNRSLWSMAFFDSHEGLLLLCRPDVGTMTSMCLGYRFLNLRPGFSQNGITHVQRTAQAIGHILQVDPVLCVNAASAPQIVIQNIDTGTPQVLVWHEGRFYEYQG